MCKNQNITFGGVSMLASRELQDFLSFKKSVPEKDMFWFFSFYVKIKT